MKTLATEDKAGILVVDDDPNLRKTVADILRVKGYDTVTAANGTEAVSAAGKQDFCVALIDLRLPDMSGLEVMEKIKAVSPLTEAIILTGHASMDTAIEATSKGAFSYLLKPYEMDELLQNIQHAVERHRTQEEIQRLASYPRLNPNPIIEIDRNGVVTYVNPATVELFPELTAVECMHPLLVGLPHLFAQQEAGKGGEVVREVIVDDDTWEEHISYVPESDVIRVYVLDITKRKRAELALAHREQEQTAVAELGTQALAGLDLPKVFEDAALLVVRELEMEYCLILELLPGEKALLLQAAAGWTPPQRCGTPISLDDGKWANRILDSAEPVSFNELQATGLFKLPPMIAQLNPVSGVALPIGPPGNPLGILAVFAASRRTFSKDDAGFLQEVANVLAAALERQRAEEEIHQLATIDSLTGVANRREFTAALEKETDRARRYGNQLSVIMYDLDHFKRINDTFGHDIGDRVLRAVTDLVKNNVRSVDLVGRWGGEEFMVMTPELDLAGARNVAEKLRVGIAGASIEGVGTVTASFGVASFTQKDDLKSILKRVDDALYLAKANGRNRVETIDAVAAGIA